MSSPTMVSYTNNRLGSAIVVTCVLSHTLSNCQWFMIGYTVTTVTPLYIHQPISGVREAVVTNSILHHLSHGGYTHLTPLRNRP